MDTRWERLIARMRKVEHWTVTVQDGIITIHIAGWLDVVATFTVEQYDEAWAFYEGYTSGE